MIKKLIAGLAGAIALNILHETIRKNFDNVPEVNEVGEEGLKKVLKPLNVEIKDKDTAYLATLASDVVSNSLYYAATATDHDVISGLLAGTGAVYLPKHLGLNDDPVASTPQKRWMTVGYYLFGAVVTRLVYKNLK